MQKVIPFLRAQAVVDKAARITTTDLYAAYLDWFPDLAEAGRPEARRTFTAAVRELAAPYGQTRYGLIRHDGGTKVSRGFYGLRLAGEDDDPLAAIPAGPLATARVLLDQSADRRNTDKGYGRDVRTLQSLLLTVEGVAWSRTVAAALIENYVDIYPELGTAGGLLP